MASTTKPYSYQEAGFNRFFRRTLGSNSQAVSLRSSSSATSSNQLNFDELQVSGSLGDILKIGLITLNGKLGRQSVHDELGNEVLRLGKLEDE